MGVRWGHKPKDAGRLWKLEMSRSLILPGASRRNQPSSHLDLSPLSLILSKMEGYLQTNSLTEAEHITQGPETLWLEGAGAGAPSM